MRTPEPPAPAYPVAISDGLAAERDRLLAVYRPVGEKRRDD
jgi:hypothetical protein